MEKADSPSAPLGTEKEKYIGMCVKGVLSVNEECKSSNFFALSGSAPLRTITAYILLLTIFTRIRPLGDSLR